MKLVEKKSGKWILYDDNGKIVIATTAKRIAQNLMNPKKEKHKKAP